MSSNLLEAEAGVEKPASKDRFALFVLVLGVIEPLTIGPQLWEVWVRKQTAGVSALTWVLGAFTSAVWMVYGLRQKDKALIVSGFLFLIMEGAVSLGVILHR